MEFYANKTEEPPQRKQDDAYIWKSVKEWTRMGFLAGTLVAIVCMDDIARYAVHVLDLGPKQVYTSPFLHLPNIDNQKRETLSGDELFERETEKGIIDASSLEK